MSIFFEEENHHDFSWEKLGDIKEGREHLGEEMPVLVYRLLEYSMNHVLAQEYGNERADEIFRMAGYKAGTEFANNVLDLSLGLSEFMNKLSLKLSELKVGILRVEDFKHKTGEFKLTISEDLDCSGLPPTDEVVCNYDEGFIAGIMKCYTGKEYIVKEVDCWASGARTCRFKGTTKE